MSEVGRDSAVVFVGFRLAREPERERQMIAVTKEVVPVTAEVTVTTAAEDDPHGRQQCHQQIVGCFPAGASLPPSMVPFRYEDFCELWLAFVLPNKCEIMCTYVKPLQHLLVTDSGGKYSSLVPMFMWTLEHCEVTKDPSLLYLIFFTLASNWGPVRAWVLGLGLSEEEKRIRKPLLPKGRELDCLVGIKAASLLIAQRKISLEVYRLTLFRIITTGSSAPATSPGGTKPPLPPFPLSMRDIVASKRKRQEEEEEEREAKGRREREEAQSRVRREEEAGQRNDREEEKTALKDFVEPRSSIEGARRKFFDPRDQATPLVKRSLHETVYGKSKKLLGSVRLPIAEPEAERPKKRARTNSFPSGGEENGSGGSDAEKEEVVWAEVEEEDEQEMERKRKQRDKEEEDIEEVEKEQERREEAQRGELEEEQGDLEWEDRDSEDEESNDG